MADRITALVFQVEPVEVATKEVPFAAKTCRWLQNPGTQAGDGPFEPKVVDSGGWGLGVGGWG